MRSIILRAAISVVLWGVPLFVFPPWVHVEEIDQAFWSYPFGKFDRHAPRWQPPFAAQVAANPALSLPVRIDVTRLARELFVASAVTFGLLTLVARARQVSYGRSWLEVVPLPTFAGLLALLLPVPPAGILALEQWEAVMDWNHGIPALLPLSIYWLVLAAGTFTVCWIVRYFVSRSGRDEPTS